MKHRERICVRQNKKRSLVLRIEVIRKPNKDHLVLGSRFPCTIPHHNYDSAVLESDKDTVSTASDLLRNEYGCP